jgi:hypothetical protein
LALMEIGEEERPCAALKPRQVLRSTCWKAHSDDERTPRIPVREFSKRDLPEGQKEIRREASPAKAYEPVPIS